MKSKISRLLDLQNLELQSPPTEAIASEIQSIRSEIPATMLVRYDRFIIRGKKGVALVQNSVCRGCQIALPVGVVNELIVGSSPQVCGNCGRYLSLTDADAALFKAGQRSDTIVVKKPAAPGTSTKTVRPNKKRAVSDNSATT